MTDFLRIHNYMLQIISLLLSDRKAKIIKVPKFVKTHNYLTKTNFIWTPE
jgi:hypothetical protein